MFLIMWSHIIPFLGYHATVSELSCPSPKKDFCTCLGLSHMRQLRSIEYFMLGGTSESLWSNVIFRARSALSSGFFPVKV